MVLSFSTAVQKVLYWGVLLSYLLFFIGWGIGFYLALSGKALLGMVQVFIFLKRGIQNNHRPSLHYAIVAIAYCVVFWVFKPSLGITLVSWQVKRFIILVLPMLLATYALFVLDRSYQKSSSPPSKSSDILDDPF